MRKVIRHIRIGAAGADASGRTAPSVGSCRTVHIVLEVVDDGSPNLTSYRRLVVTVDPGTQRHANDHNQQTSD